MVATLDRVFREEWGRVLATLIGFLGDFDLAEEAVRLADVNAADLDAEISRVKSDASDPGDESRRKRAAEREAARAALARRSSPSEDEHGS